MRIIYNVLLGLAMQRDSNSEEMGYLPPLQVNGKDAVLDNMTLVCVSVINLFSLYMPDARIIVYMGL